MKLSLLMLFVLAAVVSIEAVPTHILAKQANREEQKMGEISSVRGLRKFGYDHNRNHDKHYGYHHGDHHGGHHGVHHGDHHGLHHGGHHGLHHGHHGHHYGGHHDKYNGPYHGEHHGHHHGEHQGHHGHHGHHHGPHHNHHDDDPEGQQAQGKTQKAAISLKNAQVLIDQKDSQSQKLSGGDEKFRGAKGELQKQRQNQLIDINV